MKANYLEFLKPFIMKVVKGEKRRKFFCIGGWRNLEMLKRNESLVGATLI